MSDDEEDEANELAIDEDMSLVERVKAYCNSSISVQRLVHVRELSSCAQQIGAEETLVQLLPLLAIISSDVETPVRIAFAEQMVAFCKVLLAAPDVSHLLEGGDESSRQSAYEIVVSQCVPVLSKLLSGGSANDLSSPGGAQLCDAAAEALVELAALLKPEDVGQTVRRHGRTRRRLARPQLATVSSSSGRCTSEGSGLPSGGGGGRRLGRRR